MKYKVTLTKAEVKGKEKETKKEKEKGNPKSTTNAGIGNRKDVYGRHEEMKRSCKLKT